MIGGQKSYLALTNAREDVQSSPGDLKYLTIFEDFQEVETKTINAFRAIPDFQDPTQLPYPIVVRSYDDFTCIDGWDLVEKAGRDGREKIRCLVQHCEGCTPLELAIRKAAARCMPKAGTCSYAELIRNTRLLAEMLQETTENIAAFSHGGARRGYRYTENREHDIRVLLAERLGLSVKTISKHLTHAEFLTDETFAVLIASRATKGFFETVQSNRRQVAKNLKGSGRSDQEIEGTLAEMVPRWQQEYREKGGAVTSIFSEPSAEEEPRESAPERNSCRIPVVKQFEHHTPPEEPVTGTGMSEDEIRAGFKNALKELGQIIADTGPLREREDEIRAWVTGLVRLSSKISEAHGEGGDHGQAH